MKNAADDLRVASWNAARVAYCVLAIALGCLTFAAGLDAYPSLLFGVLALIAAFGAIFKFGWLPIATILGAFVGYIADSGVKGGTYESQMWESVQAILGGALAGLAVGFYLEARHRVMSRGELRSEPAENAVK